MTPGLIAIFKIGVGYRVYHFLALFAVHYGHGIRTETSPQITGHY
jgi:hypothetical protein